MIAQILKSTPSFLDFQQGLAVKSWLGDNALQLGELSTIPYFCLSELHCYFSSYQIGVVITLRYERVLSSGDAMWCCIDLTIDQYAYGLHVLFELWARKQFVTG